MTSAKIIEVYEDLTFKKQREPLTVDEQNLLHDCEIALGMAECEPELRKEARERAEQAAGRRAVSAPSVR